MSYITCKDLAVGYDGRAVASGLNFSIDKGDYLCIVGENGAGKSTLVKTLLGQLPVHQAEEDSQLHTGLSPEGRAAAVLPTNACNISCVYPIFQVVQVEIVQAAFPFCHKKDVLRT